MLKKPLEPSGVGAPAPQDGPAIEAERCAEIQRACDRAARLIAANDRALRRARQLIVTLNEAARQGSRPGRCMEGRGIGEGESR
jgi:hypothetical protein